MSPATGRVGRVRHGLHEGCVVINDRLRLTPEHPVLIRREGQLGFCSAELLRLGDRLVRRDLSLEPVESILWSEDRVRTVAVNVPGLNVFLAGGVWVHNDISGTGSGSGKSSGSSFSSSDSSSGSSSDSGDSSGGGSSGSLEPSSADTGSTVID